MSPARNLVVVALAVTAGAGCSDRGITGARAEASDQGPLLSLGGGAIPDVSGEWRWSAVENLSFPAPVAQFVFGIQPEGPTTHARCTKSGTATLLQVGASFTGVSGDSDGSCVTRGGQVFSGVASGAPAEILDGVVHGRSMAWQQIGAGGTVSCSMRAVISEFDGALATALNGGGPCVVPGHPQSAIPLDPPPGGHQTVLRWSAERP